MTARVLLVTGSRALADTPAAEAWARAQIVDHCHHAWWGKPPTLIVTGDARGPDTYAVEYARANHVPHERWGLDGYREQYRNGGGIATRWWPEGTPQLHPKRWPLERNRRMVEGVAEMRVAGASVRVFSLTAAWARTQGTAHTVARAREAGLVVPDPLVCPRNLGPGGAGC